MPVLNDNSNPYFEWDLTPPPADVTNVNGLYLDNKLKESFTLTKGSWRLTIKNPVGMPGEITDKITDFVLLLDESGEFKQKQFTLDRTKYEAINNKLIVDITIIDNPIPVAVIYGAVILISVIAIAVGTNSVLESVEEITVGSGGLLNHPAVWLILLAIALPAITVFYKTVKRK